ncbi:MAG: hypothetical protein LBO72_07535 [Helicobacteraceae bacterium]|jgi:hypothetical protein|nr:hypothetical protein [Helicobacteraceae bacterium]
MLTNTYLKILGFAFAFVVVCYAIYLNYKYGIERVEAIRKKISIAAVLLTFIWIVATNDVDGKNTGGAPIYFIILFPLFVGPFYFFGKQSYNIIIEQARLPISYLVFQLINILLPALVAGMAIASILDEHIFYKQVEQPNV